MAYKYQNEIEDAVDVIYEVMGEDKHGKAQRELVEVYGKAEAFDAIDEIFDDRTTSRIAKYFRAVEVINKFYDDKEASQ